jgi:hypothetical protein
MVEFLYRFPTERRYEMPTEGEHEWWRHFGFTSEEDAYRQIPNERAVRGRQANELGQLRERVEELEGDLAFLVGLSCPECMAALGARKRNRRRQVEEERIDEEESARFSFLTEEVRQDG